MDDVKDFFYWYYRPSNAVICVAGNLEANKVVDLVNKWFGDIPGGTMIPKHSGRTRTNRTSFSGNYPQCAG
jgi:predicted Zn-dependent peptidase